MIAWFAFALGLGNLLLWLIVVVVCRVGWKRLRPAVEPYLSMLGMNGDHHG